MEIIATINNSINFIWKIVLSDILCIFIVSFRLINLFSCFGILCMNDRLIDMIIKSLSHKVENPADFLPLILCHYSNLLT